MPGALHGIRIVELAAIGPAPYACMMLADQGAEVIRVERPSGGSVADLIDPAADILARSRRRVAADLKTPGGIAEVRALIATADAVVEGFRPGVMERLGLDPALLISEHPALVVGRMTGWGQTGSYAASAGHDINYIALAGVLDPLGRSGEKPTPPINLVGDFGGGGMLMAFGLVSALLHAQRTGEGQVIDCAMVDGAASLMSMVWSFKAAGMWTQGRGANLLDTGAHFYDTYETADGKFVSIASLEPQFYARLRQVLQVADDPAFDQQHDSRRWPQLKARLTEIFRTRTRDAWCALLEDKDLCFAPVLSMDEAPAHPHIAERGTFITVDGVIQPAPAPRFSATPAQPPFMTAGRPIEQIEDVLARPALP